MDEARDANVACKFWWCNFDIEKRVSPVTLISLGSSSAVDRASRAWSSLRVTLLFDGIQYNSEYVGYICKSIQKPNTVFERVLSLRWIFSRSWSTLQLCKCLQSTASARSKTTWVFLLRCNSNQPILNRTKGMMATDLLCLVLLVYVMHLK